MLTLQPELEEYAQLKTGSVDPLLEELAKETYAEMEMPQMLCGPLEGNFLKMLVQVSNAKRILEIGTFTGYSALLMAEGLPENGQIFTLDIDQKHIAFASKFIARSPHGKKIKIIEGPALNSLAKLDGPFDF